MLVMRRAILTGVLLAIALALQGCSSAESVAGASAAGPAAAPEALPPAPAALPAAGACRVGSDRRTTVNKTFAEYTGLTVSDGIAATVSVGEAASFSITMFSDAVKNLHAHVAGDTLHLQTRPHGCGAGAVASIVVTQPLQNVEGTGGAHIDVDHLDGSVSVSGGAHAKVRQLKTSVADVRASAGSPVSVFSGTVTGSVSVLASGGAPVNLGTVQVPLARLTVSGGSSMKGLVVETLQVDSSGGAIVHTTVTEGATGSCSGGGSVTISGGVQTSGIRASGGCIVSSV